MEDKTFCMNSFLMFRAITAPNKTFKEGITPYLYRIIQEREGIHTSEQLESILKKQVQESP